MGEGDGLGRPVEADRVDARDETDARRGDVDRPGEAAPLQRAFQEQRGARGGVLFGGVVRLVNEGTVELLRPEQLGCPLGERIHQRGADREIGADDGADAGRGDLPADVGVVGLPAGRADDEAAAQTAQRRQVGDERLRRAGVDGDVDVAPAIAIGEVAGVGVVDGAGDGGADLRRRGRDQLTEASVADEQDVESVGHGISYGSARIRSMRRSGSAAPHNS
jgi:hypothetical protein